MRDLTKGHEALRRGRVSIPGREYFLTVCTCGRRTGLREANTASALLRELREMDVDLTAQLRTAVVMPDHFHALIVLGHRLSLGKCVARLKGKTAAILRTSMDVGLEWERDFFDHLLRADEDRLDVFLYIYLNPYRAGLCARTARWPWYYCRDEDWAWFKDHLEEDRPPPEWLV